MGQYVPYDESESKFLNNFFCHFCIGDEPYKINLPAEGHYRGLLTDCWNRTQFEHCKESGIFNDDEDLQRYCENKSDKRLNQTPAEFYAEVDQTIIEVGMTIELVAQTINAYLHERRGKIGDMACEIQNKLESFLLPIYIALRKKGYNKADLWS
jgi:hypothetical protein